MNADVILSTLLYIISGFFLISSTSLSKGSEVFPRVIAVLLIVMSTANLINAIRKKPKYEFKNISRAFKIFSVVVIYSVVIDIVGFFTSTFIFVFSIMFLLKYRKTKYLIIIPIGVVIFTYFVFNKIFMIPVPTGFLI